MSCSQSTIDDPTLYDNMAASLSVGTDGSKEAAGTAEKLAAEHGSHSAIGEGNMDGKVIGHSPQGTTASSLHGPSEMDALVEGLSRKLADQDVRMGRIEEENSHIKYLLWNMGDLLVDLGDHLEKTGKTLKREAGRKDGDKDKQAAAGKKRRKTHST